IVFFTVTCLVHAIGTQATVRSCVTWRRSQSSPTVVAGGGNGRHRHALWPVATGQSASRFHRTNHGRADTRGMAPYQSLPRSIEFESPFSGPNEERPRGAFPKPSLRFGFDLFPARGGGERKPRDYPAPTAFFRQARCTAQVQPGGCDASSFEANSFDATSLAGDATGTALGIASFTARTSPACPSAPM